MPSYIRSTKYNKGSCRRATTSTKPAAKPYAELAHKWMTDDYYNSCRKIADDLDLLTELREYRDPYTNCDDITYEIPFGVFYNLFGLEYGVCEHLIKSVHGVKYICI